MFLPAILALLLSSSVQADEPTITLLNQPPGTKSQIQVESTKTVTLSLITGRQVATSGTATAFGITYKDLCDTPCSLEIDTAKYDFVLRGQGVTPAALTWSLKPGPNVATVKAGSSALYNGGRWLAVLGLTAAVSGGTMYAIEGKSNSWGLPLAIGGGLAFAGGIPMMISGKTKVEYH